MVELSESTWIKVRRIMREEDQQAAAELLEYECADNLPFLEGLNKFELERYRFAALKLSKGTMEGLIKAVEIGKRDWRDLLVWGGFGGGDPHIIWPD